jgi:hypothetical protein
MPQCTRLKGQISRLALRWKRVSSVPRELRGRDRRRRAIVQPERGPRTGGARALPSRLFAATTKPATRFATGEASNRSRGANSPRFPPSHTTTQPWWGHRAGHWHPCPRGDGMWPGSTGAASPRQIMPSSSGGEPREALDAAPRNAACTSRPWMASTATASRNLLSCSNKVRRISATDTWRAAPSIRRMPRQIAGRSVSLIAKSHPRWNPWRA